MITLTARRLGRATLSRQLLLERASLPAGAAIERLIGLQAQAPLAPYVGLWSRLDAFSPVELSNALLRQEVVRTHAMRSTLHLLTVEDATGLRGAFHALHQAGFAATPFARRLRGVDLEAVIEGGRRLLEGGPLTRAALGMALARQFPGSDPQSLAYAATYHVPTGQPPPRGLWGTRAPATWQALETLLGKHLDPCPDVNALVLRYLAAFGPASVADAQTWSGLTRLAEVFDRLPLERYRSSSGTPLYDLPDQPLPDEDTRAPVRFLPEYDNVLLSHADRSRVNPDGRPIPLPPGDGARTGTVLVDGALRGTWRLIGAQIEVTAEPRLMPSESAEVAREADTLATWLTAAPT